MTASLEQLKAQVVAYAHKLARREWVANHDGNVSLRLPNGQFVATPTATAKADVEHQKLLIVDEAGTVREGTGKVFGEWELHRAVYAARPDVAAVIHAHPPYATACGIAGVSLAAPVMAEPVVSLGAGIASVPFFPPRSEPGLALLASAALGADALLLENHGAIAFGPNLELAYLRMELVEHQAKIQTIARQLGGLRPLPANAVQALLEARDKAGLRAPQERAGLQSGADAQSAAQAVTQPIQRADLEALIAQMVTEEIARAR